MKLRYGGKEFEVDSYVEALAYVKRWSDEASAKVSVEGNVEFEVIEG